MTALGSCEFGIERGICSLDPVVFLYLLRRRWMSVQFSTSCKFGLLARVKSQVSETAPRARGDGPNLFVASSRTAPCSPRTRGWTPTVAHPVKAGLLLPAHAGMDPPPRPALPAWPAAPRARGDGPEHQDHADDGQELLPAHAGMDPPGARGPYRRLPAPRARGDGPHGVLLQAFGDGCSPRTRGWTRVQGRHSPIRPLLPAHAGMDRREAASDPRTRPAPRARGDGPFIRAGIAIRLICSPRMRG